MPAIADRECARFRNRNLTPATGGVSHRGGWVQIKPPAWLGRYREHEPSQYSLGHSSPVSVTADYTQSPFGLWRATVTALVGVVADRPIRSVTGSDAHETVHAVLEQLEALAVELDADLATIHQLEGDSTAFTELALREGFVSAWPESTEQPSRAAARGTYLSDSSRLLFRASGK